MINENMFCPKCGNAEQSPETYCRQCGIYLPDFDKSGKPRITPEEHIKANTFLTLLTAITSLTLAVLLYSFFLNKEDTPVIIYITAGFLTAMTAWQIQTLWRTLLLRKHFRKRKIDPVNQTVNQIEPPNILSNLNDKLLNEADLSSVVPPSVTENTTRHLAEKVTRKSS